MISLEKWYILKPLQKFPKNVGDLAKLIVAKGFKKLPKVQKIATSGHTDEQFNFLDKLRRKENDGLKCLEINENKRRNCPL